MVSIARAQQCIGRPIKHAYSVLSDLVGVGTVAEVDEERGLVRMQLASKVLVWHKPEHLVWGDRVYEPLMLALMNGENYQDAQVFVAFDPFQNEYIFIGSPEGANDDGEAHMLYVGFPLMRRVHPVRPTADPWAAYLFEEALGWADA